MKLLSKKEIAEVWLSDNNTTDDLCCPNCRDNLEGYYHDKHGNVLFCNNHHCKNNDVYSNDKEPDTLGKIKDLIPEYVCDKK